LDRDYKAERSIEHRAKFRADRPTELGDYARKKKEKKKPQQNLSPLRKLSLTGGLINATKTYVLPKTIVFGRGGLKIEIWSKAQREFARRPRSDWGKN